MSVRNRRSMKSAAAWSLLTASVLGGLLFACDEVYADPVTTAPFVNPFPDAGLTTTRNPPAPCPQAAQENSPCSQIGAVCEYGTSPDQKCNTLFVCASDARYGSYWTEQTPPKCTGVCPDTSQIVEGAPCDLGDAGSGPEAELHCTTPAGSCACTTGRAGAHAHPRMWVCKRVEGDCPPKRPLLGSACSGARVCDYGACEFKRGSRMLCEDDVWQTEIAQCE